jgi:hypothetical protein
MMWYEWVMQDMELENILPKHTFSRDDLFCYSSCSTVAMSVSVITVLTTIYTRQKLYGMLHVKHFITILLTLQHGIPVDSRPLSLTQVLLAALDISTILLERELGFSRRCTGLVVPVSSLICCIEWKSTVYVRP